MSYDISKGTNIRLLRRIKAYHIQNIWSTKWAKPFWRTHKIRLMSNALHNGESRDYWYNYRKEGQRKTENFLGVWTDDWKWGVTETSSETCMIEQGGETWFRQATGWKRDLYWFFPFQAKSYETYSWHVFVVGNKKALIKLP